jgi:two-component system LytT family response regulator
MKNTKAIIVDDSPQTRKLLRLMLRELATDIKIAGEAQNTEEAKILIEEHRPDLVFLDIEMPGKNGLQLLEELSTQQKNFYVIFITAFNQYAVQAFRLSALDYLLKPLKEQELLDALEKYRQRKKEQSSVQQFQKLAENLKIQKDHSLAIPVNYGYEYISVNEIEYLEAEGSYTQVYLVNGKQRIFSKNLKYFETLLKPFELFSKIHRSYIINRQFIYAFHKEDRGIVEMKSGIKIQLSRSCRNEFLNQLKS